MAPKPILLMPPLKSMSSPLQDRPGSWSPTSKQWASRVPYTPYGDFSLESKIQVYQQLERESRAGAKFSSKGSR